MLSLYHCPEARSMRALWILEEMGLPFELHELDFSMASLRDPTFLAVSPLGRVPCLVDGDTRVFESGAIIQYLGEHYDSETNPSGLLHRAPGHPERTDWLIWLHYAETMAVHGASLVQQRVFVGKENRSPVVQKLESKRLMKSLEVVDAAVAQHAYLLPSGFSAVDIAVGYSVHLATSFVDFTHLSHVSAYYETLRARPHSNDLWAAVRAKPPAKETPLMTEPTLFIPQIAAATTGAIVILNVILIILVGRQRGATNTNLGDGDPSGPLYRAIRSHGNLAENAGLMLVALSLLEALTGPTVYVQGLCGLFLVARLAHPVGLSGGIMPLRVLGALGTIVVGAGVGVLLLQATLFA